MARARVLIAAYYFPPRATIGARRPHALARQLTRLGYDVTVLTTVVSGDGEVDGVPSIVRGRDLLASPLNWRRDRSSDRPAAGADAVWDPGHDLWGKLFVPDVQLVSWVPLAIAAARRLHRSEPFDVVITTSPTESTHLVGRALRRRGAAWIADLRDGWRFESPRTPYPLGLQRAFDARLERNTVRRADAVVTVTQPLADDLTRRYGRAVEVITNGFDPADAPAAAPPAGALRDDRVSLVHTGGLGPERPIGPLLDALRRLAAQEPAAAARVELVLAGAPTADERELLADPELDGLARHLGFVSRPAALALQRAADVLLLMTSGVRSGEATGKLFEYLAAERPIVVVGDRSAAAGIVTDANAGWAIPARDEQAALDLLRRLAAGELPPVGEAREQFLWPALAGRYAALIEAVVSRRAAGA